MKSKHLFLTAALTTFSVMYATAQHSLQRIWETEASLPIPESVLYNAQDKLLYVAQIDGKAGEKDGKGGIAKVALDGKVIAKDWVTGLSAPKGMGKIGNKLYVADVTEVVEIDIKNGKILKKYEVEGAKFLNDLTIDSKGNIYVSDSDTHKVHLIKDGKVSTYYEELTRPNGLLAVGSDLLIADSGALKRLGTDKKITTIAEGMDKSTDGIEQVKPGEYIVTSWAGMVYYVTDKGAEKLLDTSADKINSADIGYDAIKKIVYVPTFMKNSVVAYQLK
ncbi:strictosidine synthase family protein [Dyadobacter psychrotolerans]|uniref:ATP/GTP-binding protein n=1 Tax=Dyadobacter psychrotolerans TaxID=2541721 RepID=A0A4R5DHJ2_9BACT|nr:ATP/GTP-binding protein [Dyadobacter psychrotolerans]TDE13319.1 ATP/GTP-binding protein [Dyadobacter psychrotolerans]